MSDNINWDTNEVLTWFLNDEFLYSRRFGTAGMLRDLWTDFIPNKEVDVDEVDWIYVEEELEDA